MYLVNGACPIILQIFRVLKNLWKVSLIIVFFLQTVADIYKVSFVSGIYRFTFYILYIKSCFFMKALLNLKLNLNKILLKKFWEQTRDYSEKMYVVSCFKVYVWGPAIQNYSRKMVFMKKFICWPVTYRTLCSEYFFILFLV